MEQKQQWGSRFGYLMVAAGASIGLGNIWKFPYLAYRGGGGVFLVVYLLVVLALAKPMVEMETAIGRHSGLDTVTAFECINPKWGFVGWIGNLCTIMINFYYVVVGGWVLRYLCQFIFVGNFGGDPSAFFKGFTSDPVQPIIWSMILLIFVSAMLLFGITTKVERLAKFIMPALILMRGGRAQVLSAARFQQVYRQGVRRRRNAGAVLGGHRLEPVYYPRCKYT